jgi:hypothetical protein
MSVWKWNFSQKMKMVILSTSLYRCRFQFKVHHFEAEVVEGKIRRGDVAQKE